jgi:hypothetical protein
MLNKKHQKKKNTSKKGQKNPREQLTPVTMRISTPNPGLSVCDALGLIRVKKW